MRFADGFALAAAGGRLRYILSCPIWSELRQPRAWPDWKALPMAYAKTSERREKRLLREQMRAMGLGYRDIAAEFARRYKMRPRAAWREAYGWSLQDTADRINDFRGNTGLDPSAIAAMTAPHLSEYENWPGHRPEPSGRRPTPYLLAVLAAVYDCAVADLVDLADRERLRPARTGQQAVRPRRQQHPRPDQWRTAQAARPLRARLGRRFPRSRARWHSGYRFQRPASPTLMKCAGCTCRG